MLFPKAPTLTIPIDHVGYGVKDLHAALDLFKRLGFTATREKELMAYDPETAEVRPLGQLSAHIMFEKGYIELSAPTWKVEDNHLIPLVECHSGIHILALATSSAGKQCQSCQKHYQKMIPMAQASRKIEYGSRQGTAQFNWFPLPGDIFPEGIVCFVEHLTRELVFQDEVLNQPNGAFGLAGVTLYSKDVPAMENKYRPFLDKQPIPHVHENGYLRIASDDDMASNDYGLESPNRDAIIGLDIETSSLTKVRDILLENEISFQEPSDDEIIITIPSANSFILFKEQ